MQEEMEKSDLYKFCRIFCPTLYSKYVMVDQGTQSADL